MLKRRKRKPKDEVNGRVIHGFAFSNYFRVCQKRSVKDVFVQRRHFMSANLREKLEKWADKELGLARFTKAQQDDMIAGEWDAYANSANGALAMLALLYPVIDAANALLDTPTWEEETAAAQELNDALAELRQKVGMK